MSEAFIGEIRSFGFNFAPYGWFQCNGQLLPISQYSALFSILGTTYGGNGTTNFALPNLQGNSPMHWGTGAGLNTVLGEVQGASTVTLAPTQMPGHTHPISALNVPSGSAAERSPGPKPNSYLAETTGGLIYQGAPSTPNTPFAPTTISSNGGSLPHENMQPYLVLNFCICLDGMFPSRN
jgi:microcystin-dependent protein